MDKTIGTFNRLLSVERASPTTPVSSSDVKQAQRRGKDMNKLKVDLSGRRFIPPA